MQHDASAVLGAKIFKIVLSETVFETPEINLHLKTKSEFLVRIRALIRLVLPQFVSSYGSFEGC